MGLKFKVSNLIVLMCIVVALVSVYLLYNSVTSNINKQLKSEVNAAKTTKMEYVEATKALTVNNVKKEVTKTDIDVETKLQQKKIKIENAIKKVYVETKTNEAYEKLENELVPVVGQSFGEKLVELDEPTISEAGIKFPFDKLKNVKVFFNEYSLTGKSVKCFVLVEYETKKNATTTGVSGEKKEVVITGKDFFILNYNLEKDILKYEDYQQTLSGGEE